MKAQRAAAAAAKAETAAVEVSIIAGSHSSFASINKQLKDKERVRAAAANPSLKQMVDTGKLKKLAFGFNSLTVHRMLLNVCSSAAFRTERYRRLGRRDVPLMVLICETWAC